MSRLDKTRWGVALACAALLPARAIAHTVVTPYDLPIPFAAYVAACAAILALTGGVLFLAPADGRGTSAVPDWSHAVPAFVVASLRGAAVALLCLAVFAGLAGTSSPIANIAPFLVWVVLMLGLTGVSAVLGDVFALANPWRALARLLRLGEKPMFDYPRVLSAWPAFACYVGLVWLELMAPPRPALLAWALVGYTAVTLAGAAVFGRSAWFGTAELFGLFFRVVGTMAPIAWQQEPGGWRCRGRPALSGTIVPSPGGWSLVLFVLFTLAATTYDGVWQTSLWAGLYWGNLMHWLHPLWGDDLARAQALLAPGYVVYQQGGLVAAPFAYLLVYVAILAVMRRAARVRPCMLTLAIEFAPSLAPIAVAYMFAHNWTRLLSDMAVVPFLLSDPLGLGWNMLGLPPLLSAEPPPLHMGNVWHAEVGFILAGHLASVYSAHRTAIRRFGSRREQRSVELPLLALMVAYTYLGLVVLSLPLALH